MTPVPSSPWCKSGCIRPTMHPRGQRCSSLTYRPYSRSSRLARGAPRRPRCDAGRAPRTASSLTIFTIGHSTLTADAFLALLRAHGVAQVADVRTVPRSRRHPQFERAALEAALGGEDIGYRHFPDLGGLRHPRADSINTAWQNPNFRGYADHMQSDAFARALDDLVAYAGARPTAVMCAEAVWWRCHRVLLADALTTRGVTVRHILSSAVPKSHTLTDFARIEDGRVTYPGLL